MSTNAEVATEADAAADATTEIVKADATTTKMEDAAVMETMTAVVAVTNI